MPEIVIALDAMGGDNAPGAAVEGAIAALEEWKDARILLFGQKGIAQPRERLELVETTEVITNDEAPMLAVRKKPGSSMVSAILSVKEGRAQAMVSAGSTGALLASGMVRLGRIKGVERPALATVIPSRKRPFLLIDSGANVDCLPKYLVQFGMMGSVYMHRILGVDEPRVGLVNIGAEAEKGNQLTKETFKLMQAQAQFRFEGNVEARDIPSGDIDVVVADGFAGNLILKYTEGLAQALVGTLKDEILPTYPDTVIDLKTIPDMDGIAEDGDAVRIGALAKLADVADSDAVKNGCAALAEACARAASPTIRMIWERVVSSPTRVASQTRKPD